MTKRTDLGVVNVDLVEHLYADDDGQECFEVVGVAKVGGRVYKATGQTTREILLSLGEDLRENGFTGRLRAR